ncbi:ABC transporter ATP-binding protein [Xanthomonas sp. AM6]|uniref:ABC transporter ATP-binding protein n=1 Tax=Xanthomonas sp. AM6 TaxID=2982531 RepID=UPI0021D9A796|nr:ABC transporter ATP-binding protein [Xanthomonas sp. AM6]UYB51743.1 ABC transporter ATP-binding protein [Xanthomonas sp. AM6]
MTGELHVQNIGKSYRVWGSEWLRAGSWFGLPVKPREEHWVLRGVSFSIGPGESVGIVGRNGAGKSTLLKLITGTSHPTEGKVSRRGRIAAILELGMGFNPDLTGRQNAVHSSGLMGYGQDQIEAAMPAIEAFAEIGEYFDEPVRTYSSGMQVRVAFAVATAFQPDILIIDEALSVGDAYFQAKCFRRIQEFKEQGATLILVSHAVGDIVKHCERAIFIKDGTVFADGPSRDVSNLYLDELFGKSAATKSRSAGAGQQLDKVMDTSAEDMFSQRPYYNKGEHRWGSGGASIIDYAVVCDGEAFPNRIESQSRVDFLVKVRFDQDVECAVPGFLIKTLEGIFLYGTNSFLASEGDATIKGGAGDVVVYRFSLPLALNAGNYMISLGISSGDPMSELVPLDRRYDSILIEVSRAMQFWGIVDMRATFDVVDS